jgi:alkyl hydroperoxide reductase subunit F
MYDLIILGAGPAGITAAIYAARKRLNSLVITKDVGGQAARSAAVKNYTGYQYITGVELVKKFENHVQEFKIEVKEGEEVVGVKKKNDVIEVKTDKGVYEARSLIISTGARPRTLKLPGENEFKNRGATYCATCDAPLFVNMDVAVIGGGNSALDATIQLMKIANKIYLINKNSSFRGDEVMREKIEASDKVTILYNANTLEILGDKLVSGIRVEIGGKQKTLKVRGVFIEIGSISNSDFVAEPIERNQRGEIVVDNHNRTSVPGIFAAGDVTNVPQKQIVIAAGEGAKAALSANEYLARLKQR